MNVSLTPKPSPHPGTPKLCTGGLKFSHPYLLFIQASMGTCDYPHLTGEIGTEE